MRGFLLFALLRISSPAVAAPADPIPVIFVGGYRATAAQMRCWEAGASKAATPGVFQFRGIPYPANAGSSAEEAVAGAAATIKEILREINAHPGRRYIIAGHSSGAAIANNIAVRASHPSRIRQGILDGFVSPRVENSTCWGAIGADGKTSRNYTAEVTCGAGFRVYQDQHCGADSAWCLHFSLVNKSAPANLADYAVHGYDGCDSNLDWLN
ncbi:MAG: hypothetical protein ACXVB9_21770 [Bdellovibrionota bacterium]